ncbi:NADPH-dependent 2,4-dienoyl-CoA reductase [Salipaludibacillus keqinensis]|uniref:NADPH-dependent 2,4-dienoyl-CoA reductase n=1 Tax=Salipaludibacillus keqinensis TaxID=2045207 RepID=A0A323TGC5_9BACI|nr:NADPH-dependent 2,4-dienoyl-CoA reductase [Salipaludibacillus keqinensis]PYZ91603.1 NADPH-dependent 2,4-dienoyl-CoA reductase [Salipaludibacillus keqinensis]
MGCEELFKPLKINQLTLRSRVIMGSMHVGLEGLDDGIYKLTEFYKRRAKYDVGLIVTGGAAVNPEGSGGLDFMTIYEEEDVERWKPLTQGVHDEGGAIALQLFHAGRYAYKAMTGLDPVAPSPLQSPINPDEPVALTHEEIERTIQDFAQGARRAKEAGFDAVEIMGSEGYLINQFVSPVTNKRTDQWGGSFENRIQFSLKITEAVREAVGPDYPVLFRMSGMDLIDQSTTEMETLQWAQTLEKAGADVLNIGIGWHESRVPTISMKVPRMKFVPIAEAIAQQVKIPVVASNRINDPKDANDILEKGTVKLVSMARPFLADPAILRKGKEERYDEVNTCIACNQACLDHVFEGKPASCLVNPEAGRETELHMISTETVKNLLIVGAGPAGLETARVAAERGHSVTIVDEKPEIGGQLNYSKQIPGKQEFYETLRYYRVQLELAGVDVQLGKRIEPNDPLIQRADEIIISTGIVPRVPEIEGVGMENILSYRDIFEGKAETGQQVVIIGGGGIACDLALFLKGKGVESITLLQRSKSFAKGIGKTTRWATIMEMKQLGIKMIGGIESYKKMDDRSVTFMHSGEEKFLSADNIVLAAGQLTNNELAESLQAQGKTVHIIGGAKDALGLDAKKAIFDGAVLARTL